MTPSLRVLAMSLTIGTASGGACATPNSAWKETASAARYLAKDQLSNTDKAIAKLSAADREKVDALLAEMAAQTPGVEGLRKADALLVAALPTLSDPKSAVGGDDPAMAAARSGGLAVLQGLALKSGQAVAAGSDAAQATEALRAVRAIKGLNEADRSRVEEELGVGLGGDLFVAALRGLAG